MGYETALEAAGAEIIDFNEFGSYHGTWLAFVNYKGETGIVEGSYGSCSGCDAFQAEFDYADKPEIREGKFYRNWDTWDEECECSEEEYNEIINAYNERLADFGRSYLESDGEPSLYYKEHYEHRLSLLKEDDWFSDEEKEYIEWAIEIFNKY